MRILKWGVKNPVTINLIMTIILILGVGATFKIKREMFPHFSLDIIKITVVIEDGSTPDQIDRNVVQPLLAAIKNVDGIKEIRSSAKENFASLHVEISKGFDPHSVKQEIKDEIDGIENFPEKALDPKIIFIEHFEEAIRLAIFGKNVNDIDLRHTAEFVKRDLQNKGIVSQAEIFAPRPFEISIYLPTLMLQSKNLSIQEVAEQIKANSFESQTGEIRTETHNITLKSEARKTDAKSLGAIPIKFPNGEFILLKDLTGPEGIQDSFSENAIIQEYNGNRAVLVTIKKTMNDDIIDLCDKVRKYAQEATLPDGIEMQAIHDLSFFVKDRLNLIIKNGLIGLILVLFVLSLFLEWQTAFWTAMGISFSLIGALGFLYMGGGSINMISLFAFLMTMGIIVDDAIVIGEGYFHQKEKKTSKNPAILTLKEVACPVVAMMGTTIVAFIPLLFISGTMGKFIFILPVVVIIALALSLFEALFILPAHLSHHCGEKTTSFMLVVSYIMRPFLFISKRLQPSVNKFLHRFNENILHPAVRLSVCHRYSTAIIFLGILIFLFGLIPAKIVKTSIFPDADADYHVAELTFDIGAPIEETEKAMRSVINALLKTGRQQEKDNGINPIHEYFFQVGVKGSHHALIVLELLSQDQGRKISGQDFLDIWRNNVPPLDNIASLEFSSAKAGPRGKPIEIIFSSEDEESLERAEKDALKYLSSIEGVVDINSSDLPGAETLRFKLKEEFNNLPLSEINLANAIAQIYQGIKIDTFYRKENEVKIYVRARPEERKKLAQIKRLKLSNNLTLEQATDSTLTRNAGEIKRVNSHRAIIVHANVNAGSHINAAEIRKQIEKEFLSPIVQKYANLNWSYSGEAKDGMEAFHSMLMGYIPALLTIYLILASLFRSYTQPIIIMLAIPFSFAGAIMGHFLMGLPISLLSLFGIVGLSGIAVNDSLVLIDCINVSLKKEKTLMEALLYASSRRLRPILLTSLTTIAGMAPILLETSFQAQILIPMVASIVFGLIATTFMIPILIPVGYVILEDILKIFSYIQSCLFSSQKNL